jgi:hypothetical protein
MVPPPEQAGSPDEAADNRPIVLAQNGARPAPVKEPGMVADPVPTPETTTRYQPSPKIIKQGEFSSPPRIADPGPEELNLLRAASDPNVLGSYQTQYKERAAELAQQRKDNYDQQLKAWTAKDQMLQTERANEQTFERGKSERDMNIKKLEDEAQQRARTEKFARVLGPGGWEGTSKSIEDSYKKVEGLAQQSKAINDIQSALQDNKMYTGSAADLQNTRAKILHVLGWRLDPKVVDTERFATLMAPIVAANRRMISGNQNISDKDVETALKASGGDPKLEKESLLTILNDLREGSLSMAINHQRMLRGVTGAINEPDWTNTRDTQKATPNMHQLVPQSAVNELLASPTEDAKSEFDDAFHTPGLANQVLRFRKRSQ